MLIVEYEKNGKMYIMCLSSQPLFTLGLQFHSHMIKKGLLVKQLTKTFYNCKN